MVFALEAKYKEEFIFPLQWLDELSGIFTVEEGGKMLHAFDNEDVYKKRWIHLMAYPPFYIIQMDFRLLNDFQQFHFEYQS